MTVIEVDVARVQVRTVRLLMMIEVISGLGVALGISVGALLTADMAGTALSGAVAGLLSGVVVELFGYGTLPALTALATVPLIALALRQVPPRVTGWADATD